MSVSLKSTKNVIFEAYKKLAAQAKQLEQELKKKEELLNKAPKTPTTRVETKTEIVEKLVYKAANLDSIDAIVASLDALQKGSNKAINRIANEQVLEAETLAELQKQIQEEKELIKTLYELEAGNGSLQKVMEDYLQAQKDFDEQLGKKREELEELEEETRENWEKTYDNYERGLQEILQEEALQLKREIEEYEYQLQMDRRLEDDGYAQKCKALKEQLQEEQERKDKAWQKTEEALAEKEKDFADYKEKYEGLDERLQKESKKAEGEAKGIVEREHKVKIKLFTQSNENKAKSAALRIASLKEIVEKQQKQLNSLNEQLTQAHLQAQNLAMKALEGTANTESFQAIREIALEQAKNSAKNK